MFLYLIIKLFVSCNWLTLSHSYVDKAECLACSNVQVCEAMVGICQVTKRLSQVYTAVRCSGCV